MADSAPRAVVPQVSRYILNIHLSRGTDPNGYNNLISKENTLTTLKRKPQTYEKEITNDSELKQLTVNFDL